MEKKKNLHVTFSKRRKRLFKEANELCTHTGAEVALLVFSPGKKAYSFGHSSFESVTEKFLGNKPSPNIHGVTNHHVAEANHLGDSIPELNKKTIDLNKQLKATKKHEEVLHQKEEGQHKYEWEAPIGEMNLEQLLKFKKALKELKKKVENELKRQI